MGRRFVRCPENLVPKLVLTPPNSAELLGRESLYQARFGSIDSFRRDS